VRQARQTAHDDSPGGQGRAILTLIYAILTLIYAILTLIYAISTLIYAIVTLAERQVVIDPAEMAAHVGN